MTQKERRTLISELKKEIKKQMTIILDSMEAPTMSKEEFAYYKCGVEQGIKVCIEILTEEQ